MSGYQKKKLTLYFASGTSNKEYAAVIERDAASGRYHVYGLNGRRGAATTRQPKTTSPVDLASAEALFSALVAEKRDKKGYTSDTSGLPHSGVLFSAAVITPLPASAAAAAATPAAPSTTKLSCPVLPNWLSTVSVEEFDDLLESPDYALQDCTAGVRVAVHVGKDGRTFTWNMADGAPFALAADVTNELSEWAVGATLDALYDPAGSKLTIVDGYGLAAGGPPLLRMSVSLEGRMAAFETLRFDAALRHVQTAPLCVDVDEKAELAWALKKQGRMGVLVRKLSSPFRTGVVNRGECSALLHTF